MKKAIGQFVLEMRGCLSCFNAGYSPYIHLEECVKAWKQYYRLQCERKIKSCPRFLGLGSGLPATTRQVAEAWLESGDLVCDEILNILKTKQED